MTIRRAIETRIRFPYNAPVMDSGERCPGCGLLSGAAAGPTHEYMISSPECFRLYGEILSREYSDRRYWSVHRLTVDTYAIQHPGHGDPRVRQSVSIHLVSLYLTLARNAPEKTCIAALRELSARPKGSYPVLTPRPDAYELTVSDVYKTRSPEEYRETVRQWAQETWDAWSPYHGYVRALAASIWPTGD